MTTRDVRPVAIIGISAIMPQAKTGDAFWANIKSGRYSITNVPPGRWDPAAYYTRTLPGTRTYTTLGGWVTEFDWDPIRWRLPVPPTVSNQMTRVSAGVVSPPAKPSWTPAGQWNVDSDRVAVILGNALGGEKHYHSSLRIHVPEVLKSLQGLAPRCSPLPLRCSSRSWPRPIATSRTTTSKSPRSTMPGELANVHAGLVANLLNLRGMNFTSDAACASGLAALNAAVLGLNDHQYDAVISGGIDRNMGLDGFVKFRKIGALSDSLALGPFDAGADGFVMGEGCALFVLKRLEDAERDGDKIYAVILGIGGSSDGKGKGITAPNPIGQQLAVRRGWENSGEDPATCSAIEAHGTSTRVGDAAELESLMKIFGGAGAAPGRHRAWPRSSPTSATSRLRGPAGLFKMVRSLHEKVLAPSLNFNVPNPNVDWDVNPCTVNTQLREWPDASVGDSSLWVSAFGFGGTNFHVVLEEHVPGRHQPRPKVFASAEVPGSVSAAVAPPAAPAKTPLRGALVLGGRDDADVIAQVQQVLAAAKAGQAPAPAAPNPAIANANVRVAIDYGNAEELAGKARSCSPRSRTNNAAIFKLLRSQGAFVGRGPAARWPSSTPVRAGQYANMLKALLGEGTDRQGGLRQRRRGDDPRCSVAR